MLTLTELQPFSGFPCQIFAASQPVKESATTLLDPLKVFFKTWESHGTPVAGTALFLEERFLVVAHRPQEISGCGRDALLFFVQDLAKKLGIQWLGGGHIFFKNKDGLVVNVDRMGFKQLFLQGEITPETMVFDTLIAGVDDLLQNRFLRPASQTWHSRLMVPASSIA